MNNLQKLQWVLGIVIVVGGFMFLIRACLSKYDTRSSIGSTFVFEQNGQSVILSLVRHEKTTSYEQNRATTRRSISVSYHLQTNELTTGRTLLNKFLVKHKDIKKFPIDLIGANKNIAWFFIGEPVAFNPFTLERTADLKTLEEKNPALKGKFPLEYRFYKMNYDSEEIEIITTDGLTYSLNLSTFIASELKSDKDKKIGDGKDFEKRLAELDSAMARLSQEHSVYAKQYEQNQLGYNQYLGKAKTYRAQQDSLYKERSMIYRNRDNYQKKLRKLEELQRNRQKLRNGSIRLYDLRLNCDTFRNKWYGILSDEEFDRQKDYLNVHNSYGETARSKFYDAPYTYKDTSPDADIKIGKLNLLIDNPVFIQGGLLVDKSTARVVRLTDPDGYIVLHKDKIGEDGLLVLTRVDLKGNILWTTKTSLSNLNDLIVAKEHIVILGSDRRELFGGMSSLFISIDLKTGKSAIYDYFKDEVRE